MSASLFCKPQRFISVYCQFVFLSGVCATTDVGRISRREFTPIKTVLIIPDVPQWFISVYCQFVFLSGACATTDVGRTSRREFTPIKTVLIIPDVPQWFISVYCQSVFLSGACATTDVGRTSRREFTLVREVRTTTVSRRLRKTDWCFYSVFVQVHFRSFNPNPHTPRRA